MFAAPSPFLLRSLTGFHQGATFLPPGFNSPPQLTKRDWWSKSGALAEVTVFYSTFTETGATQTMKTNQMAKLKQ